MPITLFDGQWNCCGCSACVQVCPKGAIAIQADENGFIYPWIDKSLCVECGMCKKVCPYKNKPVRHEPVACYAAAAKDEAILRQSSSGGIFTVLASQCLREGGVVYGAAMVGQDGKLSAQHIRIDTLEDLHLLQGSKYVQSSVQNTYRETGKDLKSGRRVLYSGTPCQIAGLHSYLGKEYEQLLTVDIVCHGVPSGQLFQDFLASQEEKKHGKIQQFQFRIKTNGQGMVSAIGLRKQSGELVYDVKNSHRYSYMHFFLNSYFYRENCYQCPFAAKERVADITLGDYWGFHEEHPEVEATELSNGRGVSCVLVNNRRGIEAFEKCRNRLVFIETEFGKIDRHNAQLHMPSKASANREMLLKLYHEKGYQALERYYKEKCRFDAGKQVLRSVCPVGVKRFARRVIGCIRRMKRKVS